MAEIDDLLQYLKEIDGRQPQGPASEATLQLLAENLGAKQKPGQTPAEKDKEKSVKKEKKQIDDVTDRLAKWELELRKNRRSMFSLYVGGKMFGAELMNGTASISSFSKTLSEMANISGKRNLFILAKSFEVLAKIIDTQIDNFKQLAEVGIQFSEGLFTTREAALAAQISLDVFTQAVGRSSDTLALLGGSVRGGIQRFQDISKLLQGEFRRQANGLGMTFEETTDLLTDYLEIQTAVGRAQTMSNRDLNRGAQQFILNLDQLSAITGKQRKQIADQIKADMTEKRIQGIIQSLESSMVPGVQEILGGLQGLPQQTQDAFKELIGTGGVPLSDFAQSLVRLNPEIASFARRVSFGQGSIEEFEQVIRNTANRSQQLGPGFQRLGALLDATNQNQLAANLELFRFTEFGKKRNEVEQQQLKAMEELSNATIGFKDAFKDITNILMAFLAPAAEIVAKGLGFVASGLNTILGPLAESESMFGKLVGAGMGVVVVLGLLKGAAVALRLAFSGISGIMGKLIPSFGGGGATKAVVGASALGKAGPAVAKGGLFAGAGIGALLGLSGAGAGLGIAAIGKGLQTFNNVDGKNLSDVASATKDLIAALVSGVANPVDLATAVSGMKTYAKSMSEALDDLDKDKLSLYTTKLEELAGAFREVNTNMSGAITSSGRGSQDKLDGISTLLAEIKLVMEDVANSNKNISRKTSNTNVYNT